MYLTELVRGISGISEVVRSGFWRITGRKPEVLCATFQFRLKSAQGKVENQLTVFVLSSFNTTLHADLYYEPTMVINYKANPLLYACKAKAIG